MRPVKNAPSANLVSDLVALRFPIMIARREAMRSKALAHDVFAGRISLADARAQLRGAA